MFLLSLTPLSFWLQPATAAHLLYYSNTENTIIIIIIDVTDSADCGGETLKKSL